MTKEAISKEARSPSDGSVTPPSVEAFDHGKHRSTYEKVYNFFGFTKAYNFPIYIIFAGAMVGYVLHALQFYNYDQILSVNMFPGNWYYFHSGLYRVGILLHIIGCLPAGLLVVLQFTPSVRHWNIMLHRINGYIIMTLYLLGNIGASIALRHLDDGTGTDIQAAKAMLIIMTTTSMVLAYWNIKCLQIDQHRAWMIRAIFLFGSIITSAVIDNIAAVIISKIGTYYQVWSCDRIDFLYKQFGFNGILEEKYPQCLVPNGTLDGMVVVKAIHTVLAPESAGASGTVPFGMAMWVSIMLHVIGVELYLKLTPREAERLRQVSYERQLAAGFKNPGNAGLVVSRFGDADEWKPKAV